MKILLVDDDEVMVAAIAETLTAHRYLVHTANEGQAGLQLAESCDYDLIVLDVVLPGMDGMSLCRRLRSQGHQMPILLLTANDRNTDRVAGLDAGADDYLVKPFNFEELLARVRALLRRHTASLPPVITYGGLQFEPSANEFTYQGHPLRLTPKEYLLLELFVMNPRRVFSRGVILDRLWANDEFPGEETVTTHIKSLRQRLKAVNAPPNLIETVYGLGYRLKPLAELDEAPAPDAHSTTHSTAQSTMQRTAKDDKATPTPRQQQALAAIEQLRQKFQGTFIAQIDELEQAAKAAKVAQLTAEVAATAKHIAHKLAGSLGTFGYEQGSELAREIDLLLQSAIPLDVASATVLQTRVQQLRQVVIATPLEKESSEKESSEKESSERGCFDRTARSSATVDRTMSLNPDTGSAHPPTPPKLQVLMIEDDIALTECVQLEASAWNWFIQVASNPSVARQLIATTKPDVILLDLTFPDTTEDGLSLLSQLQQEGSNIPVLVFTGRGSLTDRIEVARLGGRAFLQKPVSLEQIYDAVTQVLRQSQAVEAKVMVVDDDPAILTLICSLLQPWGLAVVTLSDPERFWEVLEAYSPDLLILDVEMPKINGIQLCQVVRNDPLWTELPILMLSAHTDLETRRQVFLSGADDYVQKPIAEPELVARVINRLERSRIDRKLSDRKLSDHKFAAKG